MKECRAALLVEAGVVLALLVAATAAIAVSGADIALSARYFDAASGWYLKGSQPWLFLYDTAAIPGYLMGFTGLFFFVRNAGRNGSIRMRRYGIFLVLLLALGPGLLVNTVFKDHWGRPRPRQVVQLGGTMEFLQVWEKGKGGAGRGFPSGHASIGFYLMSPWFLLRRRNRTTAFMWLAGGVMAGGFIGYARIIQGGHFLSDVIWAGGMVYLTGLVLARLLRVDDEATVPGPIRASSATT